MKHTIVAISSEKDTINSRAAQQTTNLRTQANTKISLLCVIPAIPPQFLQLPSIQLLELRLLEEGKSYLRKIAKELNVPNSQQYLRVGMLTTEVRKLAEELQATETVVLTEDNEDAAVVETSDSSSAAMMQEPASNFMAWKAKWSKFSSQKLPKFSYL